MKKNGIDICEQIQNLLKKINMNIRYIMLKEFESSPVTRHQLFIMQIIKENPKISPTYLSNSLCLSKSSVCLLINRLAAEGYIFRKENPKDRRSIYLMISQKGEKVLEEMKPAQKRIFMEMLSNLTNEERAEVEKSLQKLNDSIEKTIQKSYLF